MSSAELELYKAEIRRLEVENGKLRHAAEELIHETIAVHLKTAGADAQLMTPVVAAHIRLMEDGDRFAARVVDQAGGKRITDVRGTPMAIGELIDEMRRDPVFSAGFGESTEQATNGAGSPKKNVLTRAQFDRLSVAEKHRFISTDGNTLVD